MIIEFPLYKKPILILKQIKEMGPEPHFECLYENKKIVIAKQPSGIMCFLTFWLKDRKTPFVEERYEEDFLRSNVHYIDYWFFNEKISSWCKHREVGPAVNFFNYNLDKWIINGYNVDPMFLETDSERYLKSYFNK